MDIKEYAIDLELNKQPSYKSIYNLGPVELKTLKTYIEINLANKFIQPFKFPIETPILFIKKPNESLRLYVNYRALNNLIIKN